MSAEDNGKTTRIISMQIPLPWLISSAFAVFMALAGMWFNVDRLIRDVADLQITVKSGNTQVIVLSGQLELLKFRVENLENSNSRKGER